MVTTRAAGSMRTTASSSRSATQTAPAPTASADGPRPTGIGVSNPVESTRVTVLASLSTTHTASAPSATAAGPAFGSITLRTRFVRVSSRDRSPEEGAIHTVSRRAAAEPGPPGTTLPNV